MIRSFACAETQALFLTGKSRRWTNLRTVAIRKLDQLHAAVVLSELSVPPGNGQHSIRINDQWRICFIWQPDGAHAVEIVDYH
jgi:proteic killer suppression protein